ncbi:MAG: rhodanese-like domain-containing protein [Desulfobaccales bacterium]
MAAKWPQRRLLWLIPLMLLSAWWALSWWPHLAGGTPSADEVPPGVLIKAEPLKVLIDKKAPHLRVIDFRPLANYYLGHIPGAIHLWRPETENRDQSFPGQPPAAKQLETLLGRLGVGNRDTLIIYSDQCDQTHLWWLLAYYGLPPNRMRLLDGGFESWKAKEFPTQLTSPQFKPVSFRFPSKSGVSTLLATLQQVKGARGGPHQVILDARRQSFSSGEGTKEGAARPGRIPGAVSVFWEENRMASGPLKGCWKSPGELRELYASRGVTPDKDIYIYTHHERCAAFSLVSLYLAGYPLEKLHLYAGSWIEWSRSREPAETGPAS